MVAALGVLSAFVLLEVQRIRIAVANVPVWVYWAITNISS
jgi:hypothetical protein